MPIHATHPHTADTLTANLNGSAFVISPRYGESYSFDRAGRLLSLFFTALKNMTYSWSGGALRTMCYKRPSGSSVKAAIAIRSP